jgi:hypothetical protein
LADYVIWSYEHDAWWRPHQWGYTPNLAEAGHYNANHAERIVTHANLITVNERAMPLAEAASFVPEPSIECPRCRRRSFNPNDIRERYCGACHRFHDEVSSA